MPVLRSIDSRPISNTDGIFSKIESCLWHANCDTAKTAGWIVLFKLPKAAKIEKFNQQEIREVILREYLPSLATSCAEKCILPCFGASIRRTNRCNRL